MIGMPTFLFTENLRRKTISVGKITVFKGSMFSGKSTALMAEAKKQSHRGDIAYCRVNLKIMGMKQSTFNTHMDENGGGISIKGYEIPKEIDIIKSGLISDETIAIFIDEYQFLDVKSIHPQIVSIIKMGINVYISGLSTDWKGKVFESMAFACAEADSVVCLTAICDKSKEEATHNWKTGGDYQKRFEQGNHYIPVSRKVFYQLWDKKSKLRN